MIQFISLKWTIEMTFSNNYPTICSPLHIKTIFIFVCESSKLIKNPFFLVVADQLNTECKGIWLKEETLYWTKMTLRVTIHKAVRTRIMCDLNNCASLRKCWCAMRHLIDHSFHLFFRLLLYFFFFKYCLR